MKTRLELTKEQVDILVAQQGKRLRTRFEKDLASIRKKYGSIDIDTENLSPVKRTHKAKITDDMFNDYFNVQKLSIQQISEITGLNKGFLYKIRKRVQNIAYEICNTQIINLKRNICGPSWAQSIRRGS